MTTTVDGVTMTLFVNDADVSFDANWTFSMKSELSQTDLLTGAAVGLVTQNDRYMEFVVDVPADFKDKHTNGYYSWTMGPYTGFVKLITQPGGDMGTTDYISNNENREADVYFRPNY